MFVEDACAIAMRAEKELPLLVQPTRGDVALIILYHAYKREWHKNKKLEAHLKDHIAVYQVDDMAYNPEADVERIFKRMMEESE